MLSLASARGVLRIGLANARMTERSFSRYRLLSLLSRGLSS